MNRIDPVFRGQIQAMALTCPICRDGDNSYMAHGCPACGGTKQIDPTPRADLEEMAEMLRREL